MTHESSPRGFQSRRDFWRTCSSRTRGSVAAVNPITSLLRERHRIRPGDDDDFFVRTQSEVANLMNQTQSVMTLLLGGIASVSLLVGGIGIMISCWYR